MNCINPPLPVSPQLCYNESEVIAVWILCFEDSNTYGYDPRGFFSDRHDTDNRWVDLLAKQAGHDSINAGANGGRFHSIPMHSDY